MENGFYRALTMSIPPVDRRGLPEVVTSSLWTLVITGILIAYIIKTGTVDKIWATAFGVMAGTLVSRSNYSAAHRLTPDSPRLSLLSLIGNSVCAILTGAIVVVSIVKTGTVDPSIGVPIGTMVLTVIQQSAKSAVDRSSMDAPADDKPQEEVTK